jgi:REP element-mobilizing transposase RayT
MPPPILAYHAIFTAYGFWLPNDPRSSWSHFVASWEILLHGRPVAANTRSSRAHVPHDAAARLAAKSALKFPPVSFNGLQARAVARGFADAISASGYTLHACSTLPEHVHAVVARHHQDIEMLVGHLKGKASRRLDTEGLHPHAGLHRPDGKQVSPWAENCWKVFLHTPHEIRGAIAYVENNPLKDGHKSQRWSFITPYPAHGS